MVVRIKAGEKYYILTNSQMLSLILGYHIHKADDFEITLPVKFEYKYLIENALYQTIYIDNVAYIVTSVEEHIDETDEYYRLSGFNWYAHMLACSLATYTLGYQMPDVTKGDAVYRMIDMALSRFAQSKTAVTLAPENIEDDLNFNILEKGTYIMDWLYNESKAQGCICRFEGSELTIKKPKEVCFATKFLSLDKEKKKVDTNVFAILNDKAYEILRPVNGNNWASPIKYISDTPEQYFYGTSKNINDEWYVSNFVNYYFEAYDIATGTRLTPQVRSSTDILQNNNKGTIHYMYMMMTFSWKANAQNVSTKGIRLKLKNLQSPIIEDVRKALKTYSIVRCDHHKTSQVGLTFVYQSDFPFVKVDDDTYDMPEYRYPFGYFKDTDPNYNKLYYTGVIVDKQEKEQVPPFFPDFFKLAEPFRLLDALNRLPYRLFSDNCWRNDYELSEDEYKVIPIGSKIITIDADSDEAYCTDKVVTYENGELHYDVTLKSAIEVEHEKKER